MVFAEIYKIEKLKINEYLIIDKKNISISIIRVTCIIVILFVLFTQLICLCTNPLSIQLVYAQNSDIIESVKKEQLVNETKLLASYESLIANNYPYPIQFVQNLDPGPAIIHDGIVISNNSKSEEIQFNPWGFPHNLNLYNFSGPNENITLLYVDGGTSDNPAGFMSSPLRYTERYISMNTGFISKYPEIAQITIQLVLVGDKSEYILNFINGRLGYEGWLNNTYYEKISSNSSHLVDLTELISLNGDRYSYLEGINIIVEQDTQIGILQFRIDLGNSTVNTPALVNDGQSYFINGHVFQGIPVFSEYRFLFDDWQFKQILNQEFITNPTDDDIVATNNWNIMEMSKSENASTNNLHIKILSEKTFTLWEAPIFEVITHLDIYKSIISFGSPKDIIFVVIIVLLIVLAFHNGKNISADIKSGN
ncbi:hypothetical protein [Candidatus Nitrosocosmicus sp. T]